MYKSGKTVALVTVATPINENLALLDVDECLSADSLAVIHESYVNIIPILNTKRRAKYVSLLDGDRRGVGIIKEVKWLRVKGETVFIVLSTEGFQVYDAEVTGIKFFHCCKDRGDGKEFAVGACVLKSEYLCVGTSSGTAWIFSGNEDNTDFRLVDRIYAHDHPVKLLDAYAEFMVSASHDTVYFWFFAKQEFRITRKVCVPGMEQRPTCLKLSCFLVFVGYLSGEFCIYDLNTDDFCVRNVAHMLQVTDIDFSPLKHWILTCSNDCFVKVWSYDQETLKVEKLFSVFNDDGPVYGAAFVSMNCTEFCFTTGDSAKVQFYTQQLPRYQEDSELKKKKEK